MALYIGDTLIAASIDGQQLNNPFSLLDYKYSEYELSNASWLLSNGQWNSGAVYQSVYNLLLQIYNGTETKAGVSVKLSTETYADTDFVLNTGDTAFRLPIYTQRVLVKKYVNGTDWYDLYSDGWCEQGGYVSNVSSVTLLKAYKDTNYTISLGSTTIWSINGITGINTSSFSLAARGHDGTVQPVATSWVACGYTTPPSVSDYTEIKGLYFYVGETVQDANVIAAGQALTDIADLKNASNFSQTGLSTLSGLGMPSDNYDDLTLGASGTTYTTPANGWYLLRKRVTAQGQYIMLYNQVTDFGFHQQGYGANQELFLIVPAKKGDVMFLAYNAAGATSFFRFYYAEGEPNV